MIVMNQEAMDVPTDTKMPHRCTDAPSKDPMTYGVYRFSPGPHEIWGSYGIGRTYRCTGGMGPYRCMGCPDICGKSNYMVGVQTYGGHMDAP